jgi:hypothetical protein
MRVAGRRVTKLLWDNTSSRGKSIRKEAFVCVCVCVCRSSTLCSKTFPDFSWSFHKSKKKFFKITFIYLFFLRRLSSIDIVVPLFMYLHLFAFLLYTDERFPANNWISASGQLIYEKMECNANAQLKEIDKRMEAPLPLKSVWRKRHFDPSLHGIQVIGVAVKSIAALVVVWDIELERQHPNVWRRYDEPITVKYIK